MSLPVSTLQMFPITGLALHQGQSLPEKAKATLHPTLFTEEGLWRSLVVSTFQAKIPFPEPGHPAPWSLGCPLCVLASPLLPLPMDPHSPSPTLSMPHLAAYIPNHFSFFFVLWHWSLNSRSKALCHLSHLSSPPFSFFQKSTLELRSPSSHSTF